MSALIQTLYEALQTAPVAGADPLEYLKDQLRSVKALPDFDVLNDNGLILVAAYTARLAGNPIFTISDGEYNTMSNVISRAREAIDRHNQYKNPLKHVLVELQKAGVTSYL